MPVNDDIISLLRKKVAQVAWEAQRGLILQPGAIGDCVFTLPLAKFMKDSLRLGGVDILGHTEYIGILPGRTCIDVIRSIDLTDLHRLFVEPNDFDLADRDPLINVFADYAWIVTFLGEPNSNFEQNLIFTANCSHSAEVITLSMKPPEDFGQHLTEFYTKQLIDQSGLSLEHRTIRSSDILIKTTEADRNRGKDLLEEIDFDFSKKLVVIQPGSGGLNKCWHLDNFLAMAKEINSKGIEVIFLLGPAELERFSSERIKDINSVAICLTNLSLTQVLQLLICADGFVGNNPAVYRPVGPDVTVFVNSNATFAEESSATLQKELLAALLA